MATTKSKKEILDYLWEWAEDTGEWAKKLTKIVVGGVLGTQYSIQTSLFFGPGFCGRSGRPNPFSNVCTKCSLPSGLLFRSY